MSGPIDMDLTKEPPPPPPAPPAERAPDLAPEAPKAARRAIKPAGDFYWDAGEAAYAAGQYERALPAFESAYARLKDPKVLYRIAETAQKLGRHRRALSAYERYAAQLPAGHDRALVERRIQSERAALAATSSDPVAIAPAPIVSAQALPEEAVERPIPHAALRATRPAPRAGPVWLWVGAGALAVAGIAILAVTLGGPTTSTPDRVQGNLGRAVQTLQVP